MGGITVKKLCKSKSDRKIDGVCAGIGNYFNIDPTIIRLLMVITLCFGFMGGIFYIVCMFIMPVESDIIDADEYENRKN